MARAGKQGKKFGKPGKPDLVARIMELRGQGFSLQKVADLIGIKKSLVHYHERTYKKHHDEMNSADPSNQLHADFQVESSIPAGIP
jgi:hypothetical protein